MIVSSTFSPTQHFCLKQPCPKKSFPKVKPKLWSRVHSTRNSAINGIRTSAKRSPIQSPIFQRLSFCDDWPVTQILDRQRLRLMVNTTKPWLRGLFQFSFCAALFYGMIAKFSNFRWRFNGILTLKSKDVLSDSCLMPIEKGPFHQIDMNIYQ